VPTHHRRSSRGSGSTRRRTTWATVTATHSIPAANGYDAIDLLAQYKAAVGEATAGITIARIHLSVVPTAGLVTTGNSVVEGIIVSDQNDVGTNVVGAPRPAADLHLDWLSWKWVFTDENTLKNPSGGDSWDHDIRSMRKMRQVGNTLLHVMQAPASNVFPVVVQVTGRILLMLP
jgi:hypothetical protein